MNTSFAKFVLSFAALAVLATGSAFAAGKTGGGTGGSSAPVVIPGGTFAAAYVITESGSYVLGGNRSTDASVNVIEINAPDVTLDLAGFSLAQTGNGSGDGVNIQTVDNVEIRNGSVVTPGDCGIYAATGKGIRVTNLRVAAPGYAGIYIHGNVVSAQVSDCQVTDFAVYGINVGAAGSLVTDCVLNGLGVNNGNGLVLWEGSRVVRTVVRNCRYGMTIGGSSIVDCSVTACERGITMTDGSNLRGVDVMQNTLFGVISSNATDVIADSRITGSPTLVSGAYVNAGGNYIQ